MSYKVKINAQIINLRMKNGKYETFTRNQTIDLNELHIPSVLFFAINAKPQILASLNSKRNRKNGRINVKNINEALKLISKQVNDEYISSISILDENGEKVEKLPEEAQKELDSLTPDSVTEKEKEEAKYRHTNVSTQKVADKMK